MLILGLNMFHADASAAIVQDGEVVFAIAEERLNRHKHFGGFPALAVKACLDAAGARISDVNHVAVGQDSDANLAKKVQYALANPSKILNFIRLRQRKQASLVHPTRLADRGADHKLEQLVLGEPSRKCGGKVGIGDLKRAPAHLHGVRF